MPDRRNWGNVILCGSRCELVIGCSGLLLAPKQIGPAGSPTEITRTNYSVSRKNKALPLDVCQLEVLSHSGLAVRTLRVTACIKDTWILASYQMPHAACN